MQFDSLKTPSGILKILEIVCSVIVVGIVYGSKVFVFKTTQYAMVCGGVMTLSLVVTPLLLFTYLWGNAKDIQKTPFEILVNVVTAILMLVEGALMINTALSEDKYVPDFVYKFTSEKAAGSIAIITCLVYGVDAFFAFRNRE